MQDFFKYLTSSPEDKEWGLFLTATGKYTAPPNAQYPKQSHPSGYYFDWESGRVLDEYQINYITEGSGVLQTNHGEFEVKPGSVMIILPGVMHRYRPDIKTGWTENYIGFKGKLAGHFMNHAFEDLLNEPVIHCGSQLEFLDSYYKISELVIEQKPAYQKVSSGLILKLLGYISSYLRTQQFEGKEVDELVNEAKTYMWEHVNKEADFHAFSRRHHVSYSYFRKVFKLYTGIAPHQFFLDLKMMRAKELIVATDIPIKEITYKLGFDSIHYFSRLFKQKTGQSPTDLRKRV